MVQRRPLILLSNDDGIEAEGLRMLAEELRGVGDLLIVAPDGERSAKSHSVDIKARWRYQRVARDEYALDGTPADCVYAAVTQLAPRRPDLVVSGINNGFNLGTDVIYSGTVAAAAEGVVLEIPGIALSMDRGADPTLVGRAARFGAALANWVLETGWHPRWTLLNVNVPADCSSDRFAISAMGTRVYRSAPRQQESWPAQGTIELTRPGAAATLGADGEDAQTLNRGIISVTPLRLDWTDPSELSLGDRMTLVGFESEGRAGDNGAGG